MPTTKTIFRNMDSVQFKFEQIFGKGGETHRFFCPGRVNLIGEHIDYLGGLVMPAAISLGITAVVRNSDSKRMRFFSTDFQDLETLYLNDLPTEKTGSWTDFILGVLLQLKGLGATPTGMDILFDSTLPKASGLSSSAALEVLTYYILHSLWLKNEPGRTQMAVDCQKVENEFISVNCGIMDQFAVANGQADHAILLNCGSLEFEPIKINLGEFSLVIVNSNKSRQLAESAYNQRLKECREALEVLQKSNPKLTDLVNADLADLMQIENATVRARAKHAVTEQQRVLDSVEALKNDNIERFGQLLNESHASLRYDYHVSCAELDFIVDFLQSSEACLGARMTGAGFGGCCVSIIRNDTVIELKQALILAYKKQFGFAPDVFTPELSAGVHQVN